MASDNKFSVQLPNIFSDMVRDNKKLVYVGTFLPVIFWWFGYSVVESILLSCGVILILLASIVCLALLTIAVISSFVNNAETICDLFVRNFTSKEDVEKSLQTIPPEDLNNLREYDVLELIESKEKLACISYEIPSACNFVTKFNKIVFSFPDKGLHCTSNLFTILNLNRLDSDCKIWVNDELAEKIQNALQDD